MTSTSLRRGRWAEHLALFHLRQQGLTLLERNYRCRMGEIDLIMVDTDQQETILIFVEVRFRSNDYFGSAEESVTIAKQHKIGLAAQHYISAHPMYACCSARFDLIAISWPKFRPDIHWVVDAFQP